LSKDEETQGRQVDQQRRFIDWHTTQQQILAVRDLQRPGAEQRLVGMEAVVKQRAKTKRKGNEADEQQENDWDFGFPGLG
jgi:hypothetical protein